MSLNLAKPYVEFACGKAPSGSALNVMWYDHELGSYPSLAVWYEYDEPPQEYINACELALEIFDNAVSWSQLKSYFEDNAVLDEMQENDVAGPSRFLKEANPYTKKVAANEKAEYFIALCREQDQPDSVTMYQMYFINDTSAPIDIILEVLPRNIGEIQIRRHY